MGLGLVIADCLALGFAIWLQIDNVLVRYVVMAVISMRLIADTMDYLLVRRAINKLEVKTDTPKSSKHRGHFLGSSSVSVVSPQSASTPNRFNAYSASVTSPQPYQVSSPLMPTGSKFSSSSFSATPPANLSLPLHHMSPYSGITYQCSVREESQLDGQNATNDIQEVVLHDLALQELKSMRITLRKMETMAEHMRSFLAQDILRPLTNQLRENDAEFVEMRKTLLKNPQFSQTVAGTAIASCSPDNSVEIAQRFQEHLGSIPELQQLMDKRRTLDKFLTIPRFAEESSSGLDSRSPEYVRSRLFSLSSDSLMGDYHWDKGVSYKGKSWSPELAPTDTQILLHIFSKWIDEQVVPQGSFSRTCLTYRPPHAKNQRKVLNSVMIEQISIVPPYFVIVSSNNDKVSETHPLPGRHVLFNTLALFIHHINKFCGGKICRCRIASLARTRSSRIALQQSEYSDENSDGDDEY